MKLIYLTAKKYPSAKTDPFYVQSMAKAFAQILGKDFVFFVRGDVPEDLQKIGAQSVRFPNRSRTLFYFFGLPVLIFMRGWNKKDTVVLSYDPNLLSILLFWRSIFRFKYRVVSDWHQMFDDWRDIFIAKGSDHLTTTSKRLKGLLISRCGIKPEKITVAYGGVDPRPFDEKSNIKKEDLRTQLGLPTDLFLVGYVGIFTSVGLKKGVDTMIEALPFLNEHIAVVLVGGSEKEIEEYRLLAREHVVEDRCFFIKKQPFEKVIEHELAMDALVIPYPDKPHFRDYGFPMKVWEYMASGRPIIYSNLEIMDEVLKGRAHSFAPEDAENLAEVITFVVKDKEGAERIARRNPEEVRAYTWEARAAHILESIRK